MVRVVITGLGSLEGAGPDDISHLSSPAYSRLLTTTAAGAVILRAEDARSWEGDALIVDNPYLAFARISQLFARLPELDSGVQSSATVAADAVIDPHGFDRTRRGGRCPQPDRSGRAHPRQCRGWCRLRRSMSR